eukprot:1636380-Prymnesium_polylepis.1
MRRVKAICEICALAQSSRCTSEALIRGTTTSSELAAMPVGLTMPVNNSQWMRIPEDVIGSLKQGE